MKRAITIKPKETKAGRAMVVNVVALGAALTRASGLQTFIEERKKIMDEFFKAESQRLEGRGLEAYPTILKPDVQARGQLIEFAMVSHERIVGKVYKCTYYEVAKELGIMDAPLCEGLCKVSTDSLLKIIAPGYSKKILKSLWKGDPLCELHITKG